MSFIRTILRGRKALVRMLALCLTLCAGMAFAGTPVVTAASVPANATYSAGQNLDFAVTFSEAVTVGGTPGIAIVLDTGGSVSANYISGSGTSTLSFRYTVVVGNQDITGITVGNLTLNGGTLQDSATNTNNAILTLSGVPSTAGVNVDAIVPAMTSVGVPANGTYGTATGLDFQMNFNKTVYVNTGGGTPYIQVTLDTGGTVNASYLSGSGSSQLTFRYVVTAGKLDTNGIAVGAGLSTGGGTIQDYVGNNAALALNSVGSTTGVLVDSIAPTVTSINTVLASPNNLSTETFTVTFSKDVSLSPPDTTDFAVFRTGTVSGTASSVTAVSGSVYTVAVTGVTGDGTLRLDLNTGGTTVTDAYGNPLTAAHTGDQSYTIQHTPPSATGMTVPANGTYGSGQNLDFTVNLNKPVTVDTTGGTPSFGITLDVGGTVNAVYVSGSGTSTLTFRYTVTAGTQDLTGIVTGTAIGTNGGSIRDAAGNAAVLAINAVEPSTAGINVDAILPVVTSVGVPANAIYIAGQNLDFTVNLNRTVTVDTTGGTPSFGITLDLGGTVNAVYVSGSGTSTLTFRYTVVQGNVDLTGITVGAAIVLAGGSIVDSHNNPATLTLAGVAPTTGVLVNAKATQTLVFGAAPQVTVGATGKVSVTDSLSAPPDVGAITFSSSTPLACTVVSGTGVVTGVAAGTNNCTIVANQAADTNYLAATASQTFGIAKSTQNPVPALPTQPSPVGFGNLPNVLDMSGGSGPAISACLVDTLRQTLGGNPVYLGQSATGEVRVGWNGQTISFYALSASLSDARGAGIYTQSDNSLDVVTGCGTLNVTPALYNPTGLGAVLQGMGLSAQINAQGVITVVDNGVVYVVRPDFLVTPGATGAVGLVFGADGVLRFADGNGNTQVLHPAMLDPVALQAQISLMGGAMVVQLDATVFMALGSGAQFVLTPDLTLGGVPTQFATAYWWQDGASHYRYRIVTAPFGAFSQGLNASAKPAPSN